MVRNPNRSGTAVARLLAVVSLLACPRIGSAAGTWSVISLPQQPDDVTAVAVDAAGNLYVADGVFMDVTAGRGRIQQRDVQGNWSILATAGGAAGQVGYPTALAVDAANNLYVADRSGRLQQRDVAGNWSVIASVAAASALAGDTMGNLYVADWSDGSRIQKRDVQGNWSVIAYEGTDPGQVNGASALTVDAVGNLYVADAGEGYQGGRIQKRDVQGNWSIFASAEEALKRIGRKWSPRALAEDGAGNLYVADGSSSRIEKRDAQGNWSVIDGPYSSPTALAVDTAGRLYVADSDSYEVRVYMPHP
jgi:hypothetical protein